MPSGLPARVLIVCSLICGGTIAYAERRPVAVIDLSGDPATAALAAELNPVLLGHPDLQPIPDPAMVYELYGTFRDDDEEHYNDALTRKKTADDQLGRYSFDSAHESALNGQRDLQQVAPSPQVVALYAQLAFLDGQAMLGMPRLAVDAPRMFALAHRLDPTFAPDPARYLPDVVQAFEAAKKRWSGKGTLAIAGTGRLFIDGRDHGSAPAEVELDAGPHVVWLAGPERAATGRPIVVDAGRKTKLEIADAPVNPVSALRLKIRRARAALRNAPDPTARAAAMHRVAELVGVRDAVLLTSANNKIVYQTWNDGTRDPGFSELRELKNEKPADLLVRLAPPKPKPEDPDPGITLKPIERPWYRRRTWQATMAVGVAAVLISSYYIYKAAADDDFALDSNTTVGTQGIVRW